MSAVNLLTVSCKVKFNAVTVFWCLFSCAVVASLKAWRSLLFSLSFSSSWRCTSANSSLNFALRTRIVSEFWEEIVSKSYLCFVLSSRKVSAWDTFIDSRSYLYLAFWLLISAVLVLSSVMNWNSDAYRSAVILSIWRACWTLKLFTKLAFSCSLYEWCYLSSSRVLRLSWSVEAAFSSNRYIFWRSWLFSAMRVS